MGDSDSESSSGEEYVRDDRYPIEVLYCGVCGYPPEYCEYGITWDKCKVWIEENVPDLLEGLVFDEKNQAKKKKKGPGGGRVVSKNPEIVIELVERTKRKRVTYVSGLLDFNIKLNAASKLCRVKFATGCNPAKDRPGSITMNGDLQYQCAELFRDTYADKIKPEQIYFMKDEKRSSAF
eukprot:TRINITY_DN1609_c0_g1_i1.p1 TRINITY_DN1609_c0_g1~~TRINITY_DN1609_c0_g1_i1.p1  ORF type:complete len:191 (+),score=55.72 TRINITY_DN1609_c0_g1_i1:39-575(+)